MEKRKNPQNQTDRCLPLYCGQGITDYFKENSRNVPFYRAFFRGETMGTKHKAHKPMVNVSAALQESRTIQLLPATGMLFIPLKLHSSSPTRTLIHSTAKGLCKQCFSSHLFSSPSLSLVLTAMKLSEMFPLLPSGCLAIFSAPLARNCSWQQGVQVPCTGAQGGSTSSPGAFTSSSNSFSSGPIQTALNLLCNNLCPFLKSGQKSHWPVSIS